jgi:hypothetical protein
VMQSNLIFLQSGVNKNSSLNSDAKRYAKCKV